MWRRERALCFSAALWTLRGGAWGGFLPASECSDPRLWGTGLPLLCVAVQVLHLADSDFHMNGIEPDALTAF